MTDDCKSYHQLKYFPHVVHLACWVHARRKFYEIKDNFKEECAYILRLIGALYLVEEGLRAREASADEVLAAYILRLIGALYLVEEGLRAREASADEVLAERRSRSVPILAREASADEVLAERRSRSVPILAELHKYLLLRQRTCTPKSGVGAAISYTLHLWEILTRYTTDVTFPIDNNPVDRSVRSVALGRKNWLFINSDTSGEDNAVIERSVRSVALGRKNWLFINSDTSGEDNAVIMTLLRTCELLGISPLKWIKEIVPHLLICQSETDYEKLLPCNYKNFFS